MNSLDRLSGYLDALERRLRWLALTRGAAVTALAALGLTVLAVLAANGFAFSGGAFWVRACSSSWAWPWPLPPRWRSRPSA